MSSETLRALRLGDRTVDVTLAAGRIARLAPTDAPATAIMVPPLVDAHVHLDKTHVVGRIPARAHSLHEAIALAAADKARWTGDDIRARAGRALAEAEAHGIVALRTHVDWSEPSRPIAWDVLGELAAGWRGRVHVERASLSPLDLLADPDAGPAIAADVAATGGALGAFVYRDEHLPPKLEAVFGLALRHGLRLDFHVDEGLDRAAQGFDVIVALVRRHRLAGRVVTGHACSLAVRPEAEVAQVLERAAAAGIAHVVLPTTNAWLQDAGHGRTPRLRGLAPMQEARAAGVPVLVGLDNVRDAFYPYGCYDLLDAWRQAALMAHLDPEQWLDTITTLPARALGLAPPEIAEGAPADFTLISVPSLTDFISRPHASRQVYRAGRPLAAAAEPRLETA